MTSALFPLVPLKHKSKTKTNKKSRDGRIAPWMQQPRRLSQPIRTTAATTSFVTANRNNGNSHIVRHNQSTTTEATTSFVTANHNDGTNHIVHHSQSERRNHGGGRTVVYDIDRHPLFFKLVYFLASLWDLGCTLKSSHFTPPRGFQFQNDKKHLNEIITILSESKSIPRQSDDSYLYRALRINNSITA